MTMTAAEIRQLNNQDLADLEQLVRAERDRRSRLSSASANVAALLRGVKADGGDLDQVVTEARAAADVDPPEKEPEAPAPPAAEIPKTPDTSVAPPSEKESPQTLGQTR